MLWNEQQLEEQTLNNLINIPQLLGNRLQLNLEEFFIPKMFYSTLVSVVCDVLVKCHTAISTGSCDCSLSHIGYLVSKIVTSGHHGNVAVNLALLHYSNSRCSGSHDHLFRHCYVRRYDMAENILYPDQSSYTICSGYICRTCPTDY